MICKGNRKGKSERVFYCLFFPCFLLRLVGGKNREKTNLLFCGGSRVFPRSAVIVYPPPQKSIRSTRGIGKGNRIAERYYFNCRCVAAVFWVGAEMGRGYGWGGLVRCRRCPFALSIARGGTMWPGGLVLALWVGLRVCTKPRAVAGFPGGGAYSPSGLIMSSGSWPPTRIVTIIK